MPSVSSVPVNSGYVQDKYKMLQQGVRGKDTDMAGEHVQKKVEGSPSPSSLQENASGVDNFGQQGEDS